MAKIIKDNTPDEYPMPMDGKGGTKAKKADYANGSWGGLERCGGGTYPGVFLNRNGSGYVVSGGNASSHTTSPKRACEHG